MEHATELTGLAFVVLTALACGMVMAHFRQPPLVGYLLAGVLLGPTGFQVVRSGGMIAAFAEIGVLLLLFVVGMELSVRSLRYTWRIALPAVALQTAGSLAVIFALAWLFNFSIATAILIGFVIALSSTAVAIKMLEDIGAHRTRAGRITVAVLIAQDIAFLPMLLIVENMGRGGISLTGAAQIVVSVVLLYVLVRILLGNRRMHLPFYRLITGHVDLSPLAGLVYCFGAGALVGALGLSPAYGAFLAGLAIGNSAERRPMLNVVRPIQSIMLMVFFLSIGLLIDLAFVWDNLGTVVLLLLLVTLFKSALNIAILRFLKESWTRSFLAGVMMSQIGEFSFLLAASGLAVAVISPEESKLIISVTVFSLALSPFWLATARRLQHVLERPLQGWMQVMNATFVGERAFLRRMSRSTRHMYDRLAMRRRLRREKVSATLGAADAVTVPATPETTPPDAVPPGSPMADPAPPAPPSPPPDEPRKSDA